ncbi:adenylate/guanylate cyclase [Naegleria gruberi]|uniref:Adenylate/guanylate cyclase n=1 Tax=Naegleria gruberi TaxID=5762 RepID=D2V1L3_NAEGR|nr:adenylate/guanylate cyclase [Naegleria gruberi]EFC49330.1 adenylate/guanylate cyclase [Naegleria gruberi]|eukprot:XP_002682074.1 adenylate/guanylate cyclase [Naegleria gruberi strain NEG-M]
MLPNNQANSGQLLNALVMMMNNNNGNNNNNNNNGNNSMNEINSLLNMMKNNSNSNNNMNSIINLFQQQQQMQNNQPSPSNNNNQQAMGIFNNLMNLIQQNQQQNNTNQQQNMLQQLLNQQNSNQQVIQVSSPPMNNQFSNMVVNQLSNNNNLQQISPNSSSILQIQQPTQSPVSTSSSSTNNAGQAGLGQSSITESTAQTFISKSNTMGSSIKQFFNNPILSDVTFIIQGKKFYAHKLILCARSNYFNQLILVKCSNTSILEIEIQDASADIFYNILEFVYTDCTILRSDKIWDLYQAAKFYQLSALLSQCQEFIIGTLSVDNVFQQWAKAQQYGTAVVAEHCLLFAKSKYEQVLKMLDLYNNINISSNPDIISRAIQSQQQMMGSMLPPSATSTSQPSTPNSTNGSANGTPKGDIYQSLTAFTFPPPKKDEETLNTYKFPPQKEVSSSDPETTSNTEEKDRHELTQTFELWGEENTPPAAFPTRYAMDMYPSFFRIEPQEKVASSSTTPVVENSAENGGDNNNTQKKENHVKIGESTTEKGCVYRRLSVLRQDLHSVGVFFQHIISCITRMLHAERTTLFMYDRQTDELISQVAIGEDEIRIPSDRGIAGSCFQSGKSVNIPDVRSNSKFAPEVDKTTGFSTKSVICSPIVGSGNQFVGVLEVLNKHTGNFSERDEQILSFVCDLLSIFVQEQKLDEIENIHKTSILLQPSSYRRKSVAPVTMARKASHRMSISVDDSFALLFDDGDFNFDLVNPDEQPHSLLSVNNDIANSLVGPNIDPLWNYVQNNDVNSNLTSSFVSMNAQPMSNFGSSSSIVASGQVDNITDTNVKSETKSVTPPLTTTTQPVEKKRKRNQNNNSTNNKAANAGMPFMHFRIPRYELQFIQFDAGGVKKKKKT